jgi:two-component system chemotaxis response regulator CheY
MNHAGYVLIVDDDTVTLSLITYQLNAMGISVLTAKDGAVALDILDQQAEEIVLVLLDLAMPHMSGFEVCQAIRANPATSMLPVVAVTARVGPDIDTLATRVGINAVITKPFDADRLRQVVSEYISGS